MKLQKVACCFAVPGGIAFSSLLFLTAFPLKVWAETVLEKIERTGVMEAGIRRDAIPFGYLDDQGNPIGYSVDLIKLIHQQLEEQLKKPIKLDFTTVTIDNRFQMVENKTVDLVCGATTITQERLQKVDFSIPFFMTGAQFLVKIEDAPSFDINGTLANIPIAFIPGTTTQEIIPQIYPFAKWIVVKSRQEGIEKLKRGEVKAFVSDGILLIGEIVQQGNDPRKFALTPSQPITTELYGCILPKTDKTWKETVDTVIVSEDNRDLQQEWFNIDKATFPYIIRTVP